MGKSIDLALFTAIKTQRKTRSPKQVAQAKHVSLVTIERIDAAKTFADYKAANDARYANQRAKQAATHRKARKQFDRPMQGTSIETMAQEYTPGDSTAVKSVLDGTGTAPKKPWWRFW